MERALAHSLIFFISLILFRFVLDLSYVLVLAPHFSSVGYELSYEPLRYLFSWAAYFSLFFTLRSRFLLIRDYVFITVVLSLWAPLTSLWGLDANRPVYPVFVSFLSYSLVYAFVIVSERLLPLKLPYVKNGRRLGFSISFGLMIFLVIWYLYSGVNLNLNLSKVYEFRRDNEELAAFGFFAYLNNWIYKVFAVYVLSYLLLKKRFLYAGFVFLIFVFYFSASAHKSVLFTPVLIVAIWFYFHKFQSMVLVPIGFSAIVGLSVFTFFVFDDVWVSALFPNRVFMIPAHLTFLYFEFFDNNQFLYYSNSFLKGLVEYPYSQGLAQLMGDYSGQPGTAANNGFVSSAYAQAGLHAVIIYSVFVGFLIAFVDRFLKKGEIQPWFALVILVIPVRDFLISIDLLTTMLTGGMFWAFLLLFLARRKPKS